METYTAFWTRCEDPRVTLRRSWGKEVVRERFSFQISRYHALVVDGRATVDETTWQGLGMDEVFAKVDRTSRFLVVRFSTIS